MGETPMSRLYPMIIKSARILKEVIYTKYKTEEYADSVNLIQYFDPYGKTEDEKFEKILKTIRDRMDVTFDNRLGTLVMQLQMEETQLAADVANEITSQLDIFTRIKRKTNATLQREFIEQRLTQVQKSLSAAEDSVWQFRETNRRILDSPQLLILQARLDREVQVQTVIFIELKKQIEIAKIEEIKDIPLINVLDAARVPVIKTSPHRLIILILTLIISTVISSIWIGLEFTKLLKELILRFRSFLRSAAASQ